MAAERPTRRGTGKSGPGGEHTAAPRPGTGEPAPASRYVDFDPWAMLAELMETPEEEPAERTRPKRK